LKPVLRRSVETTPHLRHSSKVQRTSVACESRHSEPNFGFPVMNGCLTRHSRHLSKLVR
jgi:hypothetical protein